MQDSATTQDKVESPAPFRGPEKRRSSRYRCEGKVEMRKESCDSSASALFTDISLHGCYVESQAAYPAGTILCMTLQWKGLEIETRGEVRVSYPHLGMGIAFLGMSAENQVRLRQVLGALSRPSLIIGPGIASSLSSQSASRKLFDSVPLISDHPAALQAMIDHFEARQMLTREDFLVILKKSQASASNG
jgi:hypothetical protein